LGFLGINTLWLVLTLLWTPHVPFPIFIVLFALAMFQFGWIGSNFNSLAMEPLGHVAGTASSVLGFMGTAGGTIIGAVIGQSFNGTALPLVTGFFSVSIVGLVFVLLAERGKLFQPHNKPV
jgi:DHA1 family bicyclomycin/chloramphenicol resistance-like MFS transporter